ncbi:hypothetical protein SMICM304S_03000 [Streptomyces microflavus]
MLPGPWATSRHSFADDSVLCTPPLRGRQLRRSSGSSASRSPASPTASALRTRTIKVLRDAINDSLEKHVTDGTYKKIYEATLGLSGSDYIEPPALERY